MSDELFKYDGKTYYSDGTAMDDEEILEPSNAFASLMDKTLPTDVLEGVTAFLCLDNIRIYSRNVSPLETTDGFTLSIDT